MSLQAWLPFNGNLDNFGLNTISITGTPSYDNNGKIGACLQSQIILSNYATYLQPSHTNSISVACWIKSSRCDYIMACNAFELSCSSSWVCFRLGDGNLNTYPAMTSIKPLPDTWNHIVGVWDADSKQVLCYLNGKLVASTQCADNINFNTIRASTSLPYSGTNVKINDFRIYNHALSAKEVKELAKGLVLHYRLAGPGQPNLLTGTGPNDSGWGINQSGGTFTKTVTNNCTTFNVTAKATSWFLYYHTLPTSVRNSLKVNTTYTYSFEVKSNANFPLGISLLSDNGLSPMSNSKGITILGDNKWHKYSVQLTTISDFSTLTQNNQYFYMSGGNVLSIVSFRNAKFEEGSIATPWCPNPADALYTALGYNNNIEYDCSGYCRNGAKSGTITWDIDSPRYTTSYKLTNANIVGPIPNTLKPTESITMAIWVKLASERTSGELTLFNNFEDGGAGLTIQNTNYCMQIYSSGYKSAKIDMTGKMTQWHHFAGTFDGNNIKTYIDGELKATVAVTAGSTISYQATTPWSIGINPGPSGGSGGMSGNISDARIYATALSAEDIAELYHSAVIVDNTGKNYAYEYFEAQ